MMLLLAGKVDSQLLGLFKKTVQELERRNVLRRPDLLTASLVLTRGKRPRFKHNLRDPERITAFLADVRKFHLEKEPLFLPRFFNRLRPLLQDPSLLKRMDDLRAAYRLALKQSGIRIIHKGTELTPETLLNTYLHGKHFHIDQVKAALIAELEQADLFPRVIAMQAAVAVAKTAIELRKIIQDAEG